MALSSSERKIRARLPLTRFVQAYLPLPIAHWLIKQGLARVRLRADIVNFRPSWVHWFSAKGVHSQR
jgi:hypothetical protein